ncbi:MAG: hypothetical protein M1836_001503 [Candelina mexicana]|nr:MAG: hypothetical protein M1836_001503 [Candelina mexicana]
MARAATSHRAASARPAKTRAQRNRPYKVIQETVTQDKKKQLNAQKATPGVPIHSDWESEPHAALQSPVTTRRKQGLYGLSYRKNSISREVHRIGYHFKRSVVAKACGELGLNVDEVQQASHYGNGPLQRILEDNIDGVRRKGETSGVEISQEVLNARARDAIKDLFPMIPDRDMQEIVAWAFRKGNDKVGTVEHLSLARRVQLAVVAHIRHVYTEYDNLLKTGPWHEARKKVEEACLYRLVRWRGDEDAGGNDDLEQIVREVVVISDDDSDMGGGDDDVEVADRDSSVEIISREEFALLNKSCLEHRAQSLAATNQDQEPSTSSYSLLGMEVRRRRSPTLQIKEPIRVDRRGFTRYRAWDQALERYRKDPNLPVLVARDSMRYREEQSHDTRPFMHLPARPHVPSHANESVHRHPPSSGFAAAPRIGPIEEGRSLEKPRQTKTRFKLMHPSASMIIKLTKSPAIVQNYANSQDSLQHPLTDGCYYKPVTAGKLAQVPRGISPPRTLYNQQSHHDIPMNSLGLEPFRAPSVSGHDSRSLIDLEAGLPSIETSATHPNPRIVDRDSQNLPNDRNSSNERPPGERRPLLLPDIQERGYPLVHVYEESHGEHRLAKRQRKVMYLPLRARDAEHDYTMGNNGSHKSIVRPITPRPSHELSSSLRSPLYSGNSKIGFTAPKPDCEPPGQYVELPSSSNRHCAASQRSCIPNLAASDTSDLLSSCHKSLHRTNVAPLPAFPSTMNVVHSPLPTSSFSREPYSTRNDVPHLHHTTHVRARPVSPQWNIDGYTSQHFPSHLSPRDSRSIGEKRSPRYFSGGPISIQAREHVATKNRRPDGKQILLELSESPRSNFGPPVHEDGVPLQQAIVNNNQSQGTTLSKDVVHGSRMRKELQLVEASGSVRHDPTFPILNEENPIYVSHEQPGRPVRYEGIADYGVHRRQLPPETYLRYYETALRNHDGVSLLDERKSVHPCTQVFQ